MTAPPAVSTRLRSPLLRVKNPIDRPSGEKNGPAAPSLPATGCASLASTERTHSMSGPSPLRAQYAMNFPSCEMARGNGRSVLDEYNTPGGGEIEAWTG